MLNASTSFDTTALGLLAVCHASPLDECGDLFQRADLIFNLCKKMHRVLWMQYSLKKNPGQSLQGFSGSSF